MVDSETIKRIVSAAGVAGTDVILEIGAGRGALTKELAGRAGKVVAVEIDKKFEHVLRRELEQYENVEIKIGNVLKIIDKLKFNKIVSNIPYSICEPLIQKLFHKNFELAVLTVPEHFAGILLAEEDEKNYSELSFLSQMIFEVDVLFPVRKECFEPMPGTNSVVVEIRPKRLKTEEKLMAEILLDKGKKIKNSMREAFVKAAGMTKRQSAEKIKLLGIGKKTLDKGAAGLTLEEMKLLRKKAKLHFRQD